MKGQNTETLELKVTENNGETQNSENSKSDNGFQMMLSGLGFTRPPSGFLSQALTRCLIVLVSYGVLWSITGHEMLPGGNLFGIFIILMCAAFGGFITTRVSCGVLPSLLGMLIVGFLLRNVPGIDVAKHIDKKWSATLRSIALVVILARSGLELDPGALRRLKFTCVRLAFGPCITEAVTVAVVVRYVLDMPWLWGFQLGFVLGAVSPAVVVPQLLVLQAKGYGVEQGIPTLVMAASSCDDVLAISLFGNLYFNIFRGPIELIMGIVIGILVGVVCWYLPNNQETNRLGNRFVLLAAFALLSVFGCNAAEFSGAGALGVLSMATIAGHGWGDDEKAAVSRAMAVLWEFFQPLLFGLIGAEVTWEYMDVSLVDRYHGSAVNLNNCTNRRRRHSRIRPKTYETSAAWARQSGTTVEQDKCVAMHSKYTRLICWPLCSTVEQDKCVAMHSKYTRLICWPLCSTVEQDKCVAMHSKYTRLICWPLCSTVEQDKCVAIPSKYTRLICWPLCSTVEQDKCVAIHSKYTRLICWPLCSTVEQDKCVAIHSKYTRLICWPLCSTVEQDKCVAMHSKYTRLICWPLCSTVEQDKCVAMHSKYTRLICWPLCSTVEQDKCVAIHSKYTRLICWPLCSTVEQDKCVAMHSKYTRLICWPLCSTVEQDKCVAIHSKYTRLICWPLCSTVEQDKCVAIHSKYTRLICYTSPFVLQWNKTNVLLYTQSTPV
ncbi:uncharacterized protein LOC5514528 isoform X2 [Nematostella vectensis]|uniref:uncharacterized protein LOC5514528 isoform X2 n=1 Tax=Nematostella vectensis TaxID=45351 RepID=UPI002077837D|nr:uncharacterized protein LOC5514528 isoform X2 [Nematostella vectensis]